MPVAVARFAVKASLRTYLRDRLGRFARTRGANTASRQAFLSHARRVDAAVDAAFSTHGTHITHRTPTGRWSTERAALHREIAADLYRAASQGVPRQRRAVIAGGLAGSGKTTTLSRHGRGTSRYMVLNPDDVKEELARRDLIPAIPGHEYLAPMERAALVHEESKTITNLMASLAYHDGRNVSWDITMSSASIVRDLNSELQRHGYDVSGVFVDVTVATALKRVSSRYRSGYEAHQAGEGLGGRYVPSWVILEQAADYSGRTVNRQAFDEIRDQFTQWSVFDNNGPEPRLVEGGDRWRQ